MFVRRFEPPDSPGCRELWAELVEWHRGLYEDPSIGGPDPASGFDRYLEEHGADRLFVALDEQAVVGLAGLIVRGAKAELEPIVVARGARRHGTGRALAELAITAAREEGMRQVVVRPVARNAAALGFFHQLGFTALGHVDLLLDFERPADYWRAGETLAGREFRV